LDCVGNCILLASGQPSLLTARLFACAFVLERRAMVAQAIVLVGSR
jgi:hypothetical protein